MESREDLMIFESSTNNDMEAEDIKQGKSLTYTRKSSGLWDTRIYLEACLNKSHRLKHGEISGA